MGNVLSFDALRNVVANLGTSRDKASMENNQYEFVPLNYSQLLTLYRSNWIARKVIDIPALDAVRKWRTWDAEERVVQAVMAEEKRLQLPLKILAWQIAARLFGGAGIYIGTGTSNPMLPLNPSEIGRRGITSLNVFTHRNMAPGDMDWDIESPYYGRPAFWNISNQAGNASANQIPVHPSRLVLSYGNDLPAGYTDAQSGWGDSVLQNVITAVKQADTTIANVASLIFEAKTDVVKIPNLMSRIGDAAFERDVLKRFQLAAAGKGNNGMLILDEEEDYTQKKMTFTTIPDVMDRFFQQVSGASDIPMTRMFGMSPGGMNSTGDSDTDNYFQMIETMQTVHIGQAMNLLDELLLRSATGSTPRAGANYNWNPLDQVSEVERSEIGERIAKTLAALNQSNLYGPDALAEMGLNEMTSVGLFPGAGRIVEASGHVPSAPRVNSPAGGGSSEQPAGAENEGNNAS